MSFPSIHDAYGGFGQKSDAKIMKKAGKPESNQQLNAPPAPKRDPQKPAQQIDNGRYPSDASYSNFPIKVRCQKCSSVAITRMNSQMGTASWVWCVLLSPFVCAGIACLCFESCRDKIHYCTRCGQVVGKKFAKVC